MYLPSDAARSHRFHARRNATQTKRTIFAIDVCTYLLTHKVLTAENQMRLRPRPASLAGHGTFTTFKDYRKKEKKKRKKSVLHRRNVFRQPMSRLNEKIARVKKI